MRIPELYLPLIESGLLKFWHETIVLISPPGFTFVMRYAPTRGMVYLCFGLTMGRPRDFATGDVLVTNDYGFYHMGGVMGRKREAMKWHLDPMVESIYLYEYPHHLWMTETKPMTMEFFNNAVDPVTGVPITVFHDFSAWIFECNVDEYEIVKMYFAGFGFLGKLFGMMGARVGLKLAEAVARISSWLGVE